MRAVLFCIALALIAFPSLAGGGRSSADDSGPSCESEAELASAKRALASGDRVAALAHLLRARDLASACRQRSLRPRRWEGPGEEAAEAAWAALRSLPPAIG
jgi:hypothetical protein